MRLFDDFTIFERASESNRREGEGSLFLNLETNRIDLAEGEKEARERWCHNSVKLQTCAVGRLEKGEERQTREIELASGRGERDAERTTDEPCQPTGCTLRDGKRESEISETWEGRGNRKKTRRNEGADLDLDASSSPPPRSFRFARVSSASKPKASPARLEAYVFVTLPVEPLVF